MLILRQKTKPKGSKNMSKGSFVTGMVTGVAVGIGAAMMVNPMDERDKKKLKKNTSQMFTTLGAVADRVMDMYR